MKIKLSEILASKEALSKILDQELPIKTSFKLTKLVKFLDPELKNIEDHRIKLIKKYGEETEEGEVAVKGIDNIRQFNTEFSSLLDEEIEIDFEPIPIDSLEKVVLNAADVMRIEKFVLQ